MCLTGCNLSDKHFSVLAQWRVSPFFGVIACNYSHYVDHMSFDDLSVADTCVGDRLTSDTQYNELS